MTDNTQITSAVSTPPPGTDDGPAPSVTDREQARWLAPASIALVVLSTVLLVLLVFFAVLTVNGFRLENDRSAALAAGRQAAIDLTTFDFTTAEADVQRLKEVTTPNFENGFAEDKDKFVKTLSDGKIKMTGEATESGLLSYDGNQAHVLVAVKAQVGGGNQPSAQPRNYRMNIAMVYQNGEWLANAAEFIS